MTGIPLLTRKAPGLPDGDCVSPRCRGPEQYLEHNAAGRTRPGIFTGIFTGILAADPRRIAPGIEPASPPEAAGAEFRRPGDHPDPRRPGMPYVVAAFGARLGDFRRSAGLSRPSGLA
jgi:hypothetical protein